MFPQENRVSRVSFLENTKKAKKYYGDYLRVHYTFSDNLNVAVVVPKKVIKKAINRNKQKRRVTMILQNLLKNKHGIYIIFLQKDISLLSFVELTTEIEDIYKQIENSK